MKVSAKSEYGVRAMVQLARAFGSGPMPLSLIAEREKISLDFLEQVMLALRNEGLVKSVRGVHGGYLLARDPDSVAVGEVIQAIEGPLSPSNAWSLWAIPSRPAAWACTSRTAPRGTCGCCSRRG